MRFWGPGVLIFLLSFSLQAQQESSIWLNRFYGFDFKTYPPQAIPFSGTSNYQPNRASVSDSLGNLLFYSDGLSYFDKNHVVMPNGSGNVLPTWGTTYLPFIIAPVPKDKGKFFVFTVRLPKSNVQAEYDYTLRYSIVDMALNNGKGDVVAKESAIVENQRDEFTLIKTPEDNEGYWLVSINIFESKSLSARRVTKDGISSVPVTSSLGVFIDQILLKASPDGKFLVVRCTPGDGTHRLKVLTFDGTRGIFTLHREITTVAPINPDVYPHAQRYVGSPEFSADSHFLYLMEDSVYTPEMGKFKSFNTLVCYDLNTITDRQFHNSRQVIHTFPEFNIPSLPYMQLTPQSKIIVSDFLDDRAFHTIHNPEKCNVQDKNFEMESIPTGNSNFSLTPVFPAWYFYKPNSEDNDFAGEDLSLCPEQSTLIGREARPGYTYQWDPAAGLSNLNSATPVYVSPENTTGNTDTVTLYLKVTTDLGCRRYDSMRVLTKSINEWFIQGSKSVCPGIEEVKYWISNGWQGDTMNWNANGGGISETISPDTVLVDWGPSNPGASITAISMNTNGCADIVHPFPVKIFKFLETETPDGRDTLLCSHLLEEYKILGTNGSQYEWVVNNGVVEEGQGTNVVKILWNENSLTGDVWINESVNTELETCFGRSDTLHIINPKKMLNQNIVLKTVSVSECCDDQLMIQYAISNRVFYKPGITVLRRDAGTAAWESTGTIEINNQVDVLSNQPLDEKIMEYKLLAQNVCGDTASSGVHRNILLQAEANEVDNYISLSWNPYLSWSNGVKDYTLLKSYDTEMANPASVSLVTQDLSFRYEKITDSFIFSFRVSAKPNDPTRDPSLSNTLTLEFENNLFMPNVITPNGDGINDTWSPYPLELYAENELIVTNRWGQQVYRKKNYTGDWGGENVEGGIYFYEFTTIPKHRFYKGTIHVMGK